jgi:hypothetical protein
MEFEIDDFLLNDNNYENAINIESGINDPGLETFINKSNHNKKYFWSQKVGNSKFLNNKILLFKFYEKRNASKKDYALR